MSGFIGSREFLSSDSGTLITLNTLLAPTRSSPTDAESDTVRKNQKRKRSGRQRLSAGSYCLSDPAPAPRWFLYVPVAAVLAAVITVLRSTAFAWILESFDQAHRALAAP